MKRLFDLLSSFLVLLFFLPFGLCISLLIVLGSKGGIFYKQQRVGKDKNLFWLFKFRTMKPNSDKVQITIGNKDPRVTGVGYFLRKYKLDEIPQLINILKGEMSVVGPRPEVPKYVALYTAEQLKVLNVKPGLTDYASLEFVDESELLGASKDPEKTYIEELIPIKTKLALKYIEQQSMRTDLSIIFATLRKIIR